MTTVYFIRHARSERFCRDDRTRPLTAEGMENTKKVTAALKRALEKYRGGVFAVATHGTAFSTIVNYYYPEHWYERFMRMLDYMPYVVEMKFDEAGGCVSTEDILIIEKKYK